MWKAPNFVSIKESGAEVEYRHAQGAQNPESQTERSNLNLGTSLEMFHNYITDKLTHTSFVTIGLDDKRQSQTKNIINSTHYSTRK